METEFSWTGHLQPGGDEMRHVPLPGTGVARKVLPKAQLGGCRDPLCILPTPPVGMSSGSCRARRCPHTKSPPPPSGLTLGRCGGSARLCFSEGTKGPTKPFD